MGNRYKFTVDISAKNENVSGSCIVVTVHSPYKKITFLVDCGLYQGEMNNDAKNYERFSFNPKNVDFILLTHNHADHAGRIPKLYKDGYYNKVFTTTDTMKMLPLALKDNAKIIGLYAKKKNIKALYSEADVDYALSNIMPYDFYEPFEPHEGVKVTFLKNGHLIGSAMILVQIKGDGFEQINILFTGDYKKNNLFFTVPDLPGWVTELPLHIVCESTYGTTDTTQANKVFVENISNWLNEGKNTILIPALSLGRFQEVAHTLKCAQGKEIDSSIPIRFDGNLAIKYTNMYKNSLDISAEMKDFMPENYSFVECDKRESIISHIGKQIIVTTAGMGSFGPAQEYIPRLIEREDVGIHFTSYLSPESTGYRVLNSKQNAILSVNSIMKEKKACVLSTSEFSSHAKRDELLEFLKQFSTIRSLFINHGDLDVKDDFAKYCKKNLENCKDVSVLGNGYTIRVNEWGIVKAIREKV